MSFVKENEYKQYIQKHFMVQASTKHLENQNNIEYDTNNTSEELLDAMINNKENNIDFSYIDNETLSNSVEYERDYFKEYKMHLCLYTVDQTLRLPYIKYYLKKEDTYVFPSKQIEMKGMIDSVSNNTEGKVDSIFYNQIQTFYHAITNTNLNKDKYRGFLENDNNDVFVFIDISDEMFDMPNEYEYIIIDEILNSKVVRNTNVASYVSELFKTYTFLQTVKTTENIKVQFPKIGFICTKNDEGGYQNILKDNEEQTLLLYPKVEIENSKEAYVFSSIPLSVEKIDMLYRFACFIENFDNQDNMDNKVFEENEIQYYALENKDLFSILS